VDICIDGRRCESSDALGAESVTCACDRLFPATCRGLLIPQRASVMATRACSLFDKAATPTKQSARRFVRGAKLMSRAAGVVGRAGKTGRLSLTCATDLARNLTDAHDRAKRQADVR
jgi:hypothetical protein